MRSSFRDWCGETGVSREVAERALGHEIRNAVEKAYARTDLLERRRQLMENWSQYLNIREASILFMAPIGTDGSDRY